MTVVAGILGWPIKHSLSPAIHNYWLQKHNIQGRYERWGVRDIVPALKMLKTKGWVGANITHPHKETAFAYLSQKHRVSALAQRVGAVNTVVQKNGVLWGCNTDVEGFEKALCKGAPHYTAGCAVVLGAGGAARAVVVALKDRGAAVRVVARRPEQARALFLSLKQKGEVLPWDARHKALDGAALVVNTTPPTTKSPLETFGGLDPEGVVMDLAYVPLTTPLLECAQKQNFLFLGGLQMLLYQAVGGFEAWFGVRPRVTSQLEGYVQRC